jgi:hypothetical protein
MASAGMGRPSAPGDADAPPDPNQAERHAMRRLALIALIAFASPALAEDVTADSVLGTSVEEVTASLTAMGYEVRKAEMEDGKIEVYFVRDGAMGEVYVDTASGRVTKLDKS